MRSNVASYLSPTDCKNAMPERFDDLVEAVQVAEDVAADAAVDLTLGALGSPKASIEGRMEAAQRRMTAVKEVQRDIAEHRKSIHDAVLSDKDSDSRMQDSHRRALSVADMRAVRRIVSRYLERLGASADQHRVPNPLRPIEDVIGAQSGGGVSGRDPDLSEDALRLIETLLLGALSRGQATAISSQ